jgi:hypothetical protein
MSGAGWERQLVYDLTPLFIPVLITWAFVFAGGALLFFVAMRIAPEIYRDKIKKIQKISWIISFTPPLVIMLFKQVLEAG